MDFDIQATWQAFPALLYAARLTLLYAVVSVGCGVVLAILLNLLLLVSSGFGRQFFRLYVSFIRGVPTLILIFLFYYALPSIGIDLPVAIVGILALSINLSAFAAEILRGAIASIAAGQREAAYALGLSPRRAFRLIILPQALMRSIAPLMNEFTFVLKSTPLLSVITIVEMMRTAQHTFSVNFRPLETLLGVAIIFFVINITVSKSAFAIEHLVSKRLGR
jgi:polar amino acid transport system permease protein